MRGSDSWRGHMSGQDAAEQGKLLGAAGSILGAGGIPLALAWGGWWVQLWALQWCSGLRDAQRHGVLRALGCSGPLDVPTGDPGVSSGDTLSSPSLHSLSHQLPSLQRKSCSLQPQPGQICAGKGHFSQGQIGISQLTASCSPSPSSPGGKAPAQRLPFPAAEQLSSHDAIFNPCSPTALLTDQMWG